MPLTPPIDVCADADAVASRAARQQMPVMVRNIDMLLLFAWPVT
jgi:hypothetical protein